MVSGPINNLYLQVIRYILNPISNQNDSNGNWFEETSSFEQDHHFIKVGYQKGLHPNNPVLKSNSTDDDNSTSDYTDPEESSAPTELLAEFLSAVMLRDFIEAYKLCKRSN